MAIANRDLRSAPYAPSVPAVVVRDLVVRYGARTAVAGLDLSAPDAAVTALIGPNGAGKTSTVEACVGLRSPSSGTIEVLGTRVPADGRQRAELHQRVGVMLQDGGLYSTARPLEMVAHVAGLHAASEDPAGLLEALGIDPSSRTPIRRLSGGEQRRVAAAAALVGRPRLVFLDEPTAGLDTVGRRAFHDLLRQRVAEGLSVILTTHLMDDVERLADHVVVMARGRNLAEGTVDDLVGGDDTVTFTGPLHLPVGDLSAVLPPDTTIEEAPAGRYRIDGKLDPSALASITAWCGQHGVQTRDIRLGRRSLEDVVHDLVATP